MKINFNLSKVVYIPNAFKAIVDVDHSPVPEGASIFRATSDALDGKDSSINYVTVTRGLEVICISVNEFKESGLEETTLYRVGDINSSTWSVERTAISLEQFIETNFDGSRVEFARWLDKQKQRVTEMLKFEYFVIGNTVYSKRFDLPEELPDRAG